jgi:hypothetical protein
MADVLGKLMGNQLMQEESRPDLVLLKKKYKELP